MRSPHCATTESLCAARTPLPCPSPSSVTPAICPRQPPHLNLHSPLPPRTCLTCLPIPLPITASLPLFTCLLTCSTPHLSIPAQVLLPHLSCSSLYSTWTLNHATCLPGALPSVCPLPSLSALPGPPSPTPQVLTKYSSKALCSLDLSALHGLAPHLPLPPVYLTCPGSALSP